MFSTVMLQQVHGAAATSCFVFPAAATLVTDEFYCKRVEFNCKIDELYCKRDKINCKTDKFNCKNLKESISIVYQVPIPKPWCRNIINNDYSCMSHWSMCVCRIRSSVKMFFVPLIKYLSRVILITKFSY